MNATVIVGIVGAAVALLSFLAGTRKTNNEEVAEQARFEGVVTTKLDQIWNDLKDLRSNLAENTGDLRAEINRLIKEHEERYHNG